MTTACRGLKVKIIGHGRGQDQANAVGLASIEGSLFSSVFLHT